MKIPLGIVLESPEFLQGKHIISSLDMGHYLKLPAGTSFSETMKNESITVLEKIGQVLNQILKVCHRDNDVSLFKKSTDKLPKIKTRVFTKNFQFIEKEIPMLDVSQTDDLMPPGGSLLKKLLSSYPDFFKTSKLRMKLSGLMEKVISGEGVYILNDLYIPQENRRVIEYGEKLTKDELPDLKEELNSIRKAKKKEDFIDQLSTGGNVSRFNLFNYHSIPLKRSGEPMDDAFLQSQEFSALLQGDPEIYYIPEKALFGVMLYEKDPHASLNIKRILKTHCVQFLDGFDNKEGLFVSMKNRNPRVVIVSLDGDDSADAMIQKIKEINEFQITSFNEKTDIIFLIRNKTPEWEGKIRGSGFTFILDKNDMINNFDQFDTLLSNMISMIEQ
ncbi:MAG: hypothetical protein JW827_10705 [Spirochaetes bacterium]|nr:hypothetical protein [Spirochaetota bacterium]